MAAAPQPLPLHEATTLPGGQPPRYLSRAAWGADESYRLNPDGSLDTLPEFFGVQTLTVYHSAFDDDEVDPAATVRSIYYSQAVTKDWGDIGYQLLIDADGRVYKVFPKVSPKTHDDVVLEALRDLTGAAA